RRLTPPCLRDGVHERPELVAPRQAVVTERAGGRVPADRQFRVAAGELGLGHAERHTLRERRHHLQQRPGLGAEVELAASGKDADGRRLRAEYEFERYVLSEPREELADRLPVARTEQVQV